MTEPTKIIEPTETIQMPAPSWAPAFLALGILGLLAGTFASNFMFPAWWYAALGFIFVVGAIRSLAKKGKKSFYHLPRESEDVRAELPVESFRAPTHE